MQHVVKFVRSLTENVFDRFRPMYGNQFNFCGVDGPVSNNTNFMDLLDTSVWFAAPKSKVTKSRKRMRLYFKRPLKNIEHFEKCNICGDTKLQHRLCMDCYRKGKYDRVE